MKTYQRYQLNRSNWSAVYVKAIKQIEKEEQTEQASTLAYLVSTPFFLQIHY